VEVQEDRQAERGRRITLNLIVFPALRQNHAPDPLFVLNGGPGQGVTDSAGEAHELFRRMQISRDIVLVDQRGTGKSNPLLCPSTDNEDDGAMAADADRLRACLDSYRDIADVTKYTTEIAMEDLEDVRRVLQYQQINLYGVSYGTRAALIYARRYPNRTRALILDSAAPPPMRVPLNIARDSQRAMDLLLRDCDQDIACRQRFPNLRERLDALLNRLATHPALITYVAPTSGIRRTMGMGRATFANALFATLYSPGMAAMVPLLIEQAERDDFTGLLAFKSAFGALSKTIAEGMQVSVICSEDAPYIDEAAIARESHDTFLGADLVRRRLRACEFWPRGRVNPADFELSESDVPALILSGDLDPVTPPRWGAQLAERWKNARQIVIPGAGHDTAAVGCVTTLMTRFLDTAAASSVNASCIEHLTRPPFFLGPFGPGLAAVTR